jgi:replicative DNA helicase
MRPLKSVKMPSLLLKMKSSSEAPSGFRPSRGMSKLTGTLAPAIAKPRRASCRNSIPRRVYGFSPTLTSWTGLTGGFRPGELVLFTAETGVGKTLLAQQTRRRACKDGRHTLFCSGEMRAQHLISREIATEARVEHWKMRRPERFSESDSAISDRSGNSRVRSMSNP